MLGFWVEEASAMESDSRDFKKFKGVFCTFIRFIEALEEARTRFDVESAGSIGSDYDAGEIDPEKLSEALEAIDLTENPLSVLGEHPTERIKFLNNRETGDIEGLVTAGATGVRLALSVLRCDIFGDAQARIIQAMRKKKRADKLETAIDKTVPIEENYVTRGDKYKELGERIEKMLLASLAALIYGRSAEAIPVILKLRPDIDLSALREEFSNFMDAENNVVALNSSDVSEHFLTLLEDPERVGEELANLVADARSAHRGFNREGFKEEQDEELIEGFERGTTALLDIKKALDDFVERLKSLPLQGTDWKDQFDLDRRVFTEQFKMLYGGTV